MISLVNKLSLKLMELIGEYMELINEINLQPAESKEVSRVINGGTFFKF